jgi:hypothetical protein
VQRGGLAVGRLVAVHPDARADEHGGELRAVTGPGIVEERTEVGCLEAVLGAAG